MALSFDDHTQLIVASILNGQNQERYECLLSTCPSPACGCWVIYLDLLPADAESHDPRPPSRRVEIDLWDKKLAFTDKSKPSQEESRFAELFLRSMTDEDFDLLCRKHFEIKNRQTEEAPPEAIDAHFDFREIERDGVMQGYNDVLPFADRLHVTLDGREYLVFDQYCILPGCSCADANLCVVHFNEVTRKGNEISCVGVNYRKRKWTMVEEGPLPLKPDALRTAMEQAIPDLYGTLSKRHVRLKTIYASNKKKRSSATQPVKLPKVGRNEPCPCGSGKKFKKCCADKTP